MEGGYPMEFFIKINDRLTVGSQPKAEDLEYLAQQGYKTIINLRTCEEESKLSVEEEGRLAQEKGFRYINLPLSPSQLNDQVVEEFQRLIHDPEGAPYFVHCSAGRRAGAMCLLAVACEQNWLPEQTFLVAKQMGFDCDSAPALKAFFADYLQRRQSQK